jgi:hypothetical protein
VVIPAIAKTIHREGPGEVQSLQPYTAGTATHHHSQKRDERKIKCMQA